MGNAASSEPAPLGELPVCVQALYFSEPLVEPGLGAVAAAPGHEGEPLSGDGRDSDADSWTESLFEPAPVDPAELEWAQSPLARALRELAKDAVRCAELSQRLRALTGGEDARWRFLQPASIEPFAFDFGSTRDRAAALAACRFDPLVTKFKPSIVPKVLSEADYFSCYFSHVALIRADMLGLHRTPPAPFASEQALPAAELEEEEEARAAEAAQAAQAAADALTAASRTTGEAAAAAPGAAAVGPGAEAGAAGGAGQVPPAPPAAPTYAGAGAAGPFGPLGPESSSAAGSTAAAASPTGPVPRPAQPLARAQPPVGRAFRVGRKRYQCGQGGALGGLHFETQEALVRHLAALPARPAPTLPRLEEERLRAVWLALSDEQRAERKSVLMDLLRFSEPPFLGELLEAANATGAQLGEGFWQRAESRVARLSGRVESFTSADLVEAPSAALAPVFAAAAKLSFDPRRDRRAVQAAWLADPNLAHAFRELIPNFLNRSLFWRNYLYSVAGCFLKELSFSVERAEQRRREQRRLGVAEDD